MPSYVLSVQPGREPYGAPEAQAAALTSYTMNKVPQITFAFWVMKICATTLGETAGDLLSMTMNVGYAVSSLILIGVFAVTLAAQLASKSYHPFLYWTVILSTSTAGTTMSDYMDRTLGLGYRDGLCDPAEHPAVRSRRFGGFPWARSRSSNVRTFRVELFYWTAILFSNTLGTALGDFLADSSGLGFAGGALLIASLIALIALAYFCTQISKTLLFWMAFVLTRPFGATLGDVLTKSHDKGGLDFGTVGASLVLASVLIVLIFTTRDRKGSS